MHTLCFTTTGGWDLGNGFGCASLGLAGVCGNDVQKSVTYPNELEGIVLTGSYESVLAEVKAVTAAVHAAVVLFGNAGGENGFLAQLQAVLSCPMVGGGAAIDGATGRKALLTGGGEVAILLITDDRYRFEAVTRCIHSDILEECTLTLADPRTILTINGVEAATFLSEKRNQLGLEDTDFEHLTLSDLRNVNAHLSLADGMIKSGRDVHEKMLLRFVSHESVYGTMEAFYDDADAIVFGCAGLSGLLDRPLETNFLGLFLFGEVCTVDGVAEFGNLRLSKLRIIKK